MLHSGTLWKCSWRGFSASRIKTLSERIFLCESFTLHVEVTHKSKNGFMNSAFNHFYIEKETLGK